jgi:hypothetical protein
MRSTLAVIAALLLLLDLSTAEAADPTQLAQTGGYLLGNAHRCGVPADRIKRAGKVIHNMIEVVANDPSEVEAADSQFIEIFVASAFPDQDQDAFPSCKVVIAQFERLEEHHRQAGMN